MRPFLELSSGQSENASCERPGTGHTYPSPRLCSSSSVYHQNSGLQTLSTWCPSGWPHIAISHCFSAQPGSGNTETESHTIFYGLLVPRKQLDWQDSCLQYKALGTESSSGSGGPGRTQGCWTMGYTCRSSSDPPEAAADRAWFSAWPFFPFLCTSVYLCVWGGGTLGCGWGGGQPMFLVCKNDPIQNFHTLERNPGVRGKQSWRSGVCTGGRTLPAMGTPLWGTPCLPQSGLGGCWSFFFPQQVFSHMDTQLYEIEIRKSGALRLRCLWVGVQKQLAPARDSGKPQGRGDQCFPLEWAGGAYYSICERRQTLIWEN